MMRLFIGLGLPGALRNALQGAVDALGIRGRLTDAENYHLTLAFLGGREAQHVPELETILRNAANDTAPFSITVRSLGFFGRQSNALLHAVPDDSAPLRRLAETVRARLTAAGETFDDKPFAAHITLARKADLSGISLQGALPPAVCRFTGLTLYHSTRVDGRLRYLPLQTLPFQRMEN